MFLFGSLMAPFVGLICHCIGGSSWCNHKRDVFMNGALTDECELTTTEEGALSSPVLTRDDIHHSDGPGSLSHFSSFCVQSHTETQKDTTDMHWCTQIHSISLKCLGSQSFSSGGDWCWGETVIREKPERRGVLSSLVSPLAFDLLEHFKVASESTKICSSMIRGH